ncbi:MAG: trypsin-like peptidase domain-containing protein [Bdellovibrionales bacterium]|nr:trypsin-like peptidase domain-containing protein [Bdellovibrionales bacterium]
MPKTTQAPACLPENSLDSLTVPRLGGWQKAALLTTALLSPACRSAEPSEAPQELIVHDCPSLQISEEERASLIAELRQDLKEEMEGQISDAVRKERIRLTEAFIDALLVNAAQDQSFTNAFLDTLDHWSRDATLLRRDILETTVKLEGNSTAGSGVVLSTLPVPVSDQFFTSVLTCWHVVRDIIDENGEGGAVTFYQKGTELTLPFHLFAQDAERDLAVVYIESPEEFHTAQFACPTEVTALDAFDPVVATGCPLGIDPIPTLGHVSDTNHMFEGERYLQMTAPTYIGNSGGGIFDLRTREVVGIFSHVYSVGRSRQSIVPHLGLAVPGDDVDSFLSLHGFSLDADGHYHLNMKTVSPHTTAQATIE